MSTNTSFILCELIRLTNRCPGGQALIQRTNIGICSHRINMQMRTPLRSKLDSDQLYCQLYVLLIINIRLRLPRGLECLLTNWGPKVDFCYLLVFARISCHVQPYSVAFGKRRSSTLRKVVPRRGFTGDSVLPECLSLGSTCSSQPLPAILLSNMVNVTGCALLFVT